MQIRKTNDAFENFQEQEVQRQQETHLDKLEKRAKICERSKDPRLVYHCERDVRKSQMQKSDLKFE